MLSATLLIFIKEPFALQTAACGVLMLWAAVHRESIWEQPLDQLSRRSLVVGGVWLLSAGLGYFYFATHYLLPYFAIEGWVDAMDGEAFGWLGHGLVEIILTIVTRPYVIAWDIITTSGKLIYLGVVFGMLVFVSLLRPAFLIPALPMLAIAMLSRSPNHYDYNTHYTAGLIIPVIFAFVYGLPQAEKIWEKLIIRMGGMLQYLRISAILGTGDHRRRIFYVLLFGLILVGHVMLSPSPISRLFWSDKVWTYSWQAYVPTERVAMIKSMIEKYIPADPDISVTTQNQLNYSHLAHRKVYSPFPMGIAEPQKVMDWSNRTWDGLGVFLKTGYKPAAITYDRYADYVVLDLKRPYFLMDRGCGWIYGKCRDKKIEKKFLDWVAYTRSIYDTVFERDGFMILRRRGV
ncbi:MAG: DUF2079 domain-containing protein [Proteobacteria bacterium]|nr:DUF2079 domain-containing protein [Pseudomonadota bacterium]